MLEGPVLRSLFKELADCTQLFFIKWRSVNPDCFIESVFQFPGFFLHYGFENVLFTRKIVVDGAFPLPGI